MSFKKNMFNARKSFSSSFVREWSQPPFFQAASFEYYKHNFTSFSRVTSTQGFFEINIKKVLFFEIIPTPSLWYFSECKQTNKKILCLGLEWCSSKIVQLPPKNRNEKNKKNYVTNCTTNYSSKNLAVKFLLYVLEHTNLASTIKKRKIP